MPDKTDRELQLERELKQERCESGKKELAHWQAVFFRLDESLRVAIAEDPASAASHIGHATRDLLETVHKNHSREYWQETIKSLGLSESAAQGILDCERY